jgi:uncharacterized protein (TIGR03435 family)
VEAKANGATGTEMMGILLLDLMKQRFHLQTHTEPKDTPVYLLTAGGARTQAETCRQQGMYLTTHDTGGITKKDIALARKLETLAAKLI